MRLRYIFLALFTCSCLHAADIGDYGNTDDIIRIGLVSNVKEVEIQINGKTRVTDLAAGKSYKVSTPSTFKVAPIDKNGLVIAKRQLGPMVRITPLEGEERLKFNGKSYRGTILMRIADNSTLTVVEELGLEEYITGVLTMEMGAGWPIEALRAQAVAARTYALASMKRFDDIGFDLSADIRSQAYGGANYEDPDIIEAVHSTSGEVLTYEGKIIPAFYHAACGGHTSPPPWGGDRMKPLNGVICRYCKESKHYNWTVDIPNEKILAFLSAQGLKADKVKDIRITGRDRGGRAVLMKFSTNEGGKTVYTKDFRNFIGGSTIKSSYILKAQRRKTSYRFYGRGWGHGVGMCQDGAMEMGRRGKNYKQILEYYYPGADIVSREDAR